ncbi:mechanosensitive ion channel family protein [Klebsiella pneumoniae subsp. pneumoniae]|nr:mechanosensitive ion channel family protein [Klebsiella pneumoniae subsp. pneumoniae]
MSNKSPIIIISSLGAVAAVLMIVFQHTLLSLVANVQLSSNDVLQLGDWIEMPDKNLSGEVTDIALHTITIRNWDNTISRIPTKNFPHRDPIPTGRRCSPPGRGGSCAVSPSISTRCVFLDQEMLSSMLTIRGVSEPLATLLDGRDPGGVADRWFIDNGLTNLTLFRHYLMHYLAERPDIIKEMYIVARTLKPSPSGIPLEIYCFTTSTLWKDYENTQSAIFEYITAVAGQFSLRLYQYPAGHDFWRLSQEHAARTGLPPSAEG